MLRYSAQCLFLIPETNLCVSASKKVATFLVVELLNNGAGDFKRKWRDFDCGNCFVSEELITVFDWRQSNNPKKATTTMLQTFLTYNFNRHHLWLNSIKAVSYRFELSAVMSMPVSVQSACLCFSWWHVLYDVKGVLTSSAVIECGSMYCCLSMSGLVLMCPGIIVAYF